MESGFRNKEPYKDICQLVTYKFSNMNILPKRDISGPYIHMHERSVTIYVVYKYRLSVPPFDSTKGYDKELFGVNSKRRLKGIGTLDVHKKRY